MPDQTHFVPKTIPCGQGDGTAFWSINPDGNVILFIHGFRGTSIGTWVQFPSLLQSENSCSGKDIIFYTYDTMHTPIANSGSLFFQFIDKLFCDFPLICNETIDHEAKRRNSFKLKTMTIVAHSLGAVAARYALVQAFQENKVWLQNTRLILFAPAHHGARVQNLLMSTVTMVKWLKPIAGLALYQYPTLEELKPNSNILKQIIRDTENAKNKPFGDKLLAHRVIYGATDKVVNVLRYSDDPPHIAVPGKDHITVCKPDSEYRLPVEKVVDIS